ncbi:MULTISPECIES: branched-chain amino acid transport system II carrier protein [unclassified Caldibacillus]|uniref:branched-chain amino acid transport system II carrier protein n=1 Tax=Caldibacillus sp. 210928-DFI.2.22 TaxID=2883265 RepID=UPI002104E99C|nr:MULTISPECIES: branched-chain amino acid transport system II carrier protein [unclassified Caldibacillus]
MKQLTKKEILFFGFTLFSMLFGAGNLIFPAYLGNAAGDNVWQAVTGFIISDAGLAILGFIAIANAGTSDILANRVHSTFAFLFPLAIYLAIGPGLAIPRAGSLAYEMGIKPFFTSYWYRSICRTIGFYHYFFQHRFLVCQITVKTG